MYLCFFGYVQGHIQRIRPGGFLTCLEIVSANFPGAVAILKSALTLLRSIYSFQYLGYKRMKEKIKTSIMIDADVWAEFKVLASSKKGLKGISEAVEEALEEELTEKNVAEALEKMDGKKIKDLQVKPVKPKIRTSAGLAIAEMRAGGN